MQFFLNYPRNLTPTENRVFITSHIALLFLFVFDWSSVGKLQFGQKLIHAALAKKYDLGSGHYLNLNPKTYRKSDLYI